MIFTSESRLLWISTVKELRVESEVFKSEDLIICVGWVGATAKPNAQRCWVSQGSTQPTNLLAQSNLQIYCSYPEFTLVRETDNEENRAN